MATPAFAAPRGSARRPIDLADALAGTYAMADIEFKQQYKKDKSKPKPAPATAVVVPICQPHHQLSRRTRRKKPPRKRPDATSVPLPLSAAIPKTPSDLGMKMENIVARGTVAGFPKLTEMKDCYFGAYDPVKFPSCSFHDKDTTVTASMYATGEIGLTGGKSAEISLLHLWRQRMDIYSHFGVLLRISNYGIVNIALAGGLNGLFIDLDRLKAKIDAKDHRAGSCSYKPSLFPGLKWGIAERVGSSLNSEESKMKVLLFASGAINIVGVRSLQDVETHKQVTCPMILDYLLDGCVRASGQTEAAQRAQQALDHRIAAIEAANH